jgi:hypothetical protein
MTDAYNPPRCLNSLEWLLTQMMFCSAMSPLSALGSAWMFFHGPEMLFWINCLLTFVLIVYAFDAIEDIHKLFDNQTSNSRGLQVPSSGGLADAERGPGGEDSVTLRPASSETILHFSKEIARIK